MILKEKKTHITTSLAYLRSYLTLNHFKVVFCNFILFSCIIRL